MSNPVVVRHIEQPDQAAVAALEKYGVSTVHEAQGRSGYSRLTCVRFMRVRRLPGAQ